MKNETSQRAVSARHGDENANQPRVIHPVWKARENPRSLCLAVNAKCWKCCGGPDDRYASRIKRLIRECHITDCPLWPVRPYQPRNK